jgi:hypothetical protein
MVQAEIHMLVVAACSLLRIYVVKTGDVHDSALLAGLLHA